MDYTQKSYFDDALQGAAERLISKANGLSHQQFTDWKSQALNISSLHGADADRIVSNLKSVKKPVIYFFQFKDKPNNKPIVNRIRDYKENGNSDTGKKENRSCVKVRNDSDTEFDTKVLYVGSTGSGFHGRVKQHLGFGPKGTYALQLVHWAKNLDLQLTLYWMELHTESHDFRYDIEDALAEQMKPLVGKRGTN